MNRITYRLLGILLVVALACGVGCDDSEADDVETTEQAEQLDEQGDDADQQDDESDDEASATRDDDEGGGDDEGDEADEDGEADDADDSESDDQADEDEADDEETAADGAIDLDALTVEDFEHLPMYATGPVAVVDGEEIPAAKFNVIAEQQLAQYPPEALQTHPQQAEQLKQMLIQGTVAGQLIEREIERQDIQISAAEIDEALDEFEQLMEAELGSQISEVRAMMEQQGVDEAMLRDQIEQQLAAEKLVTDSGDLTVTDQEVRQFYNQYTAQMASDEPQTRARHILLNVDDHNEGESNDDEMRQKAQQLAGQVGDSEEKFAELAREHSDCPSAPQGGDLGYFHREQLMPEFTDVAFDLSPGEVSEPVRSNLGWHVIRVEDRREGGGPEFEEVQEELRIALEAQKLQQAAAGLVQQLQSEASVEMKSQNVEMNF